MGDAKQNLRVNTVDAKNRLNELLAEVERTKRPMVVERRGRPVAVVVDYESYEREKQGRESRHRGTSARELWSFHLRMKKKYPKGTGDSVEILREVRLTRGFAE